MTDKPKQPESGPGTNMPQPPPPKPDLSLITYIERGPKRAVSKRRKNR